MKRNTSGVNKGKGRRDEEENKVAVLGWLERKKMRGKEVNERRREEKWEIGVIGNARGAEQENETEITSRRTRGMKEYGSRGAGRHRNEGKTEESPIWRGAVEIVEHCRYTAILSLILRRMKAQDEEDEEWRRIFFRTAAVGEYTKYIAVERYSHYPFWLFTEPDQCVN